MPFQSQKQRSFMYANHPVIAKRWEKETPSKKLPTYKAKGSSSGAKEIAKKQMQR